MIVGSTSLIPAGFRINNLEVTVPLGIISACHLLWPFALNPWFISFSVSLAVNTRNELTSSSRHIVVSPRFGLLGRTLDKTYIHAQCTYSYGRLCVLGDLFGNATLLHCRYSLASLYSGIL